MDELFRKTLSVGAIGEREYHLLERGILFLDQGIGPDSCQNFCRNLLLLGTNAHTRQKPIWVILNSSGGDIYQGLAIHDTIRMFVEAGIETHILGIGLVASVAAVILQAGTNRYALPNTQFLIHQLSESMLFRHEELVRINNAVMNIIAQRCGIPLEELLAFSKNDYWIGSENALQFGNNGLIDEILTTTPF